MQSRLPYYLMAQVCTYYDTTVTYSLWTGQCLHIEQRKKLSHTFNGGVVIEGSLLKLHEKKVHRGNCVSVILTARFISKTTERISIKSGIISLE
jgi:hypothetical protein